MSNVPIDIDAVLQSLDQWAEEGERYDFARIAAAVIREVRDDAAKFMLEAHKLTAQLAEAETRVKACQLRAWQIDDVEWDRVEQEMKTPPFIRNVSRSDFRRMLRALLGGSNENG